jgi:hypothetical protein
MIFSPTSLCAAAAFATLLSSGSLSLAQTPADQLKVAYQAGRNQLGVMMYCSDKGHIGSDVVDIQKKLIGMIPAPADKSGGDEAEAQGKKGVISMMGMTQDIEAVSKMQNSTPAAFCKTMGDALKQAAAALPK